MNRAEEPRTLTCARCGARETEEAFGKGFQGWVFVPFVKDDSSGKNPELCRSCVAAFLLWLEEGKQKLRGGL